MSADQTNTAEAVERATPRPWMQSEFGKGASVFGPTPAHHFIATANSQTQPHGTNIANAALIVAAVNAYGENRAELDRLRSRIMEMEKGVVDYLRHSGGRFNMQEDDIELLISEMIAARVLTEGRK